jgi:hypothetical protein
MRRLICIKRRNGGRAKPARLSFGVASAALAAVALLGAGIAVAHEGGSKAVKQVSATFTATTASDVRTSTCTGSDNVTYTTTRGRWTGAAAGDPTLTGNATVDAELLVNSAGDGVVSGKLRIDGANHTSASFDGVISGGTHIAGLAEGHGSAPWSRLIANLSADWTSAGGFTLGKVGGGTLGGNAVVLTSGGCKPSSPPKPETIELHGAFTLSTGTITVAGVTCTVPSTLASSVAKLQSGARVEIKCTSASGTNTLTRVDSDHHGEH